MPGPVSSIFSVEQYEAEQCELESAAIIQSSRKALAEFQSWAQEERHSHSEFNRQTRVVIDETRSLLGLSRSTRAVAHNEQPEHEPHEMIREKIVSLYRAQFIKHDGTVFRVEEFFAANDAAATERAKREFRSGTGMGFRILENDRHVHTEYYR